MTGAYAEFRDLLKQGRFEEAVWYAEREYLQSSKGNTFWLTQKATALLRSSNFEQALKTAQEALQIETNNPYALTAVSEALMGLGRLQEALSYFEEAVGHPRLKRRVQKGILECLARQKSWEQILQRIAQWELPEPEAMSWKVKALIGRGNLKEAEDACRHWLELKPHYPTALWELTEIEIGRDSLDEVLSRLGRTARIPSLPPIYREIYASLCRRAGKPDMAIEQYEKIAAVGTENRIQRKQAFVLAKSGREREAIEIIEELLRLDPRDMYLHSSYGAACGRLGEIERGINFYQRLMGLFPEEKSLYGRINRLRRKLEGR